VSVSLFPKKTNDKKRVMLKMSGEALIGVEHQSGIDHKVLLRIASEIKQVVDCGVQLAIVIGGGNLFRGAQLSETGLDRVTSDHMGMLGTIMNALALRAVFEQEKIPTRVMSAIPMSGIVDHYDRRLAMHYLSSGLVVLCAAGTGNPLVTTDSAASLRAIEMGAEVVLKATNVNGVYNEDPAKNKDATMYQQLSFSEVLQKELAVMDLAAFCQCRDHDLPIRIFNINKPGALFNAVMGKDEGTLVTN
jgi:uridylate kinase